MEINRRDFIKGAALTGSIAALGGLSGCAPQASSDAETGGQSGSSQAAADVMTADMYRKPWSFEIAPDPVPEDQIAETVEADLVVVGAGTSGLVAANSAIEEGLSVVVVAASKAPVARGGSNNAVYSKAMEAAGIPKMDVWDIQKEIMANYNSVDQRKWYRYYNNSETATNWMIDIMEGAGFYTAIEQNNYMKAGNIYSQALCSHSWVEEPTSDKVSQNQTELVNQLAKRLEELGGSLHFQMRGVQLERADDGRISSVIAEDLVNGGYKRFTGHKAVVLAAGDFSADREMMYKYCPCYAPAVPDETYDGEIDYDKGLVVGGLYRGDMHKAALWAGAAWQKTVPNCAMIGTFSVGATVNRYQNFWGLLLDRNGERFMNEYESRALGPIAQSMQDGSVTYAIWDTAWFDHFEWFDIKHAEQTKVARTREEVIAEWDKKVEDGSAVKADTIEELVKAAGLPSTAVQSIERYNKLCESGFDEDFYKDPDMLIPVKTPPFYCEANDYSQVRFYTVLGGLRTNKNCQVCDENDDPLPGLYAVGTMIGDLFAGVYTFMLQGGNYGAACLTLGYLTGKYIAENE